jgi:hypothetical protein
LKNIVRNTKNQELMGQILKAVNDAESSDQAQLHRILGFVRGQYLADGRAGPRIRSMAQRPRCLLKPFSKEQMMVNVNYPELMQHQSRIESYSVLLSRVACISPIASLNSSRQQPMF